MNETMLDRFLGPLLADQPMTYAEMMALTGYSRLGITNWLRTQTVHVAGWATDRRGRFTVPRFKLGKGANKPRPPAKSSAERMRTHRERAA